MMFYVYMLKSINNNINRSYVGYTNNVSLRLEKHNSGKGAKATRGYRWKVIFIKRFRNKKNAMSYEYRLKKDKKKRKELMDKDIK